MPTPNPGESRNDYMGRCMVYGDLQKYDEKQRAAICEHLYDREERSEQATMTAKQKRADGTENGDRFEQTSLGHPQIDREAGVLHRVHIMGRHSKHGYEYGLAAQRANQQRWSGMTVGIDHAYDGSPMRIEQAWGEIVDPIEVDQDGTWGGVKYLKRHPLTEQILEAAESGMEIGLSAVTRVRREQNKVVEDFIPVRLDLVVGAATVPNLFEQGDNMADEMNTEMTAEDHSAAALHAALDACLAEDTAGHEKAKKMAKMIKAMHDDKEPEKEVEKKAGEGESEEEKKARMEKEEADKGEKMEQARLLKDVRDRFEQSQATIARLENKLAAHDKTVLRHEQALSDRAALKERAEAVVAKAAESVGDLKKFWNV